MKKTIATIAAGVALLASALPVFAHGGGPNYEIGPEDPNCMGQLASLHANGKDNGNKPDTIKGFRTNQNHPNLGGPYQSTQEQAKGFQEFCGLHIER